MLKGQKLEKDVSDSNKLFLMAEDFTWIIGW